MVEMHSILRLFRESKAALIKSTFRLLFFLIMTSLLLTVVGTTWALAQGENEPSGFDDVHLWIYPEYDDPRLLVMLEGRIVGVQAPATVRFLVPSAAEMYSAGSIDAQGHYSGGPPHREPSAIPGWDEISYELTSDTFRVEYYDPIIIGLPDKTISYEFRWLYPISSLHVVVQEPRQSSNFSVSPEGILSSDSQGFTNHTYGYDDLDNEPPISFSITYTKSNTLPSLSVEDDESTNPLLIVTAVVGLCVIFGAGLFWVIKSRPKNRAERKQTTRSKSGRGSTGGGKRTPRIFCSQCGQSMEKSSRYCQHCGTKLT
jgi:hypothetical protein